MRTLAQLLAGRSRPLEGHAALSDADVAQQLKVLPEWQLVDASIARTYRFENYYQTIAFVNALAWVVHAEDHHPDLQVSFNRCEVRFNTHSVKGISETDFVCAAKADAVYAQQVLPA